MSRIKKLTPKTQAVILFNEYIMFQVKESRDFQLYDEYKNIRFMAIDLMEENNLMYSDLPVLNKFNAQNINNWCKDQIDLDMFK